jgi:uncharacterized protein with PIN domain
MIVVDSSAVAALRRQEEERAAREARMRNALEILEAVASWSETAPFNVQQWVRRVAREGLGRETET